MKKFLSILVLLTLAFGVSAPAWSGNVTIQAIQNGKYGNFVDGYFKASFSARNAFVFEMIQLEGRQVAFRDPATGRYLRAGAGDGGISYLALGGTRRGSWQTFKWVRHGARSYLISTQNNKYVRAGVGRGAAFAAEAELPGAWQEFRIVSTSPVRGSWAAPFAGIYGFSTINTHTGRPTSLSYSNVRKAEIHIHADGRFEFSAGCNSISGTMSRHPADRGVYIANTRSTRMGCPAEIAELERLVVEGLSMTNFIRVGQDVLSFVLPNKRSAVFEMYRR